MDYSEQSLRETLISQQQRLCVLRASATDATAAAWLDTLATMVGALLGALDRPERGIVGMAFVKMFLTGLRQAQEIDNEYEERARRGLRRKVG